MVSRQPRLRWAGSCAAGTLSQFPNPALQRMSRKTLSRFRSGGSQLTLKVGENAEYKEEKPQRTRRDTKDTRSTRRASRARILSYSACSADPRESNNFVIFVSLCVLCGSPFSSLFNAAPRDKISCQKWALAHLAM